MSNDKRQIGSDVPDTTSVGKIAGVTGFLWIVSGYALSSLGDVGMLMSELVILLPAFLIISKNRFNLSRAFRIYPISVYMWPLTGVLGLALTIVSNVIHIVFNNMYPMPREIDTILENMLLLNSFGDLILIILTYIVAAAICEELFFRGFIQSSLEQSWHPLKAIALTSILFCLLHPIWWMPSTLFKGFVLGLLAYLTKSVYPGIIIHLIHNGFAILLSQMDMARSIWVMETFILQPFIVVGSTVVLSGGLLFLFRRNFLNSYQDSVFQSSYISDSQV